MYETGGESTSGGNRDKRCSEDDRERLYANSEGEVRVRCLESVCGCVGVCTYWAKDTVY